MQLRLKKIVDLIKDKKIPLFVLTVDNARLRGRIDMDFNFQSYLETMNILKG